MRHRRNLLLTSAALLTAATASNAASFSVSSEAELTNAIALAQASGDPSSTITMTSSFSITGPVPEVAGKDITVETGGNTLTLTAPAFNVDNGASLTLSGNVVADGSAMSKTGAGQLLLNGSKLHLGEGTTQITGGNMEFGTSVGGTIYQMAIANGNNTEASIVVSGAGTRLAATGSDGLKLGGGQESVATLTVKDGARFESDNVFSTTGHSSTEANINVSGSGSTIDGTGLYAPAGTVNITIEDGARWFAGINNIYMGGRITGGVAGAQTFANVSGADTEWRTTGRLYLMNGSMTVSEGAAVSAGDVQIASGRGTLNADVTVTGAGSTLSGTTMDIGAGTGTGAGSLTIADGGQVSVDGGTAALEIGSRGTLNIGGADTAAAAGTLNASGIALDTDGVVNFNHTDTDYAFDVAVTGDGTLNQRAGHTIMTDDQTGFVGTTNVSGGTLSVNGTLGGVLNVLTNGRLQGSGTVGFTDNAGTIAPGNSIGTLTIAGDYAGSGGLLEIESVLGDDSSATDLLHVTGNTSGATNVEVVNLGGSGALTNDGIRIVQVDGTSAGAFDLLGDYEFEGDQAVIGGAYAYRLYQGSISDPADGDWYLRSSLLPVSPDPAPSPSPLYQPGVPIYETYANVLGSFNSLETLQQRVGNRMWAETRPDKSGVWGRVTASHSKIDPKASTSGAEYELDLWKMQAGADGQIYENGSGRFIGGVALHYGTMSSDISSMFGNGTIDSTGYGVSSTLTWYGNSGLYVDAQAQATWFDSDLVSGTASRSLVSGNNGFGYALGVEVGKRLALRDNWSVTPQAQLVYSDVDFDTFSDVFGATVGLERGDSLTTRLGISVDRTEEWQDQSGKARRRHVYGIANLYYDVLDGSRSTVSGVEFVSEKEPLWVGAGVGGSYNWNDDQYSLYGEASLNSSVRHFGDSYLVKANAGIRVHW